MDGAYPYNRLKDIKNIHSRLFGVTIPTERGNEPQQFKQDWTNRHTVHVSIVNLSRSSPEIVILIQVHNHSIKCKTCTYRLAFLSYTTRPPTQAYG